MCLNVVLAKRGTSMGVQRAIPTSVMNEPTDDLPDKDETPKGRSSRLSAAQQMARALRLAKEAAELTKAIGSGDL